MPKSKENLEKALGLDSMGDDDKPRRPREGMKPAGGRSPQLDSIIIDLLTGKKTSQFLDVSIHREGAKIILPEGMSYDQARDWLTKQEEKEQTVVQVHETVHTYPLDGAHALMAVLSEKYGWTTMEPGGFFSAPPAYIGVPVSYNKTIQVAWGKMTIPGMSGPLSIVPWIDNGAVLCAISAQVKLKDKEEVHEIIEKVRAYVREHSIYKGKAIRVDFPDLSEEGFQPAAHSPEFIDTSQFKLDDVIFTPVTQALIKTNLWTPIMHTAAVRRAGISLKRGILLEGPYGVGKTLTAMVTAKLCEENNWTYIYIKDVRRLADAMRFGRMYSPALIFTEDLDRASENAAEYGGDDQRGEVMNQILNTIDGVEYKNSEIMVVMSTNHLGNITKAMLRPGRLDAIISMTPPDAQTVPMVIKHYARGLLEPYADLTEVGRMLAGQIPASIREVVERAKLAAIGRSGGEGSAISAVDLQVAAESMLAHFNLLADHPVQKFSKLERAAKILVEGLTARSEDSYRR